MLTRGFGSPLSFLPKFRLRCTLTRHRMPQHSGAGGPAVVRKERVFRWWDYLCFIPLSALQLTALTWFMLSWLTLVEWRQHPVLLGLLAALFVYNVLIHQFRWPLLPCMRRPR